MARKLWLMAVVLATLSALAPQASAQKKKESRVITLNEITIVGRVQRPIAAVDVARIRPKITLSELRRPFMDRIEQAIYREPF